jgi:hypothetical protein
VRRWKWYAGLVVTVVVAGAAGVSYAAEDDHGERVPADLVPPAGNVLAAAYPARGVQIYQCTAGAWTFVEPSAALQERGRTVIIHFRGPSWESIEDGSLVEGAVAASSPVPGSVPQLLLRAAKNRGDGVLGRVTYIQRLATRGGAAPTGACAAGATESVAYQALYRFFTGS